MAAKKKKSKNPASKRDYKKEYARDQKKRIPYRSALNKINAKNQKSGKTSKGDDKDEAHVKSVRSGGSKSGKTKPQKASKNRAWRKGKSGYK